jgi:hypothetical protein
VFTTTSMTAVSASIRSAQSTLRSAEIIQVNSVMRSLVWPKPIFQKAIQESTAAIISSDVVMISAAREPAAAGSAGAW